ncbi:MAG: DUF1343 domain-containing protein, partial [Ignavibacteriales bacterium]|nr:DUF1343 domain-containing protein [Ignavibacteriales bacterium]
FVGIIPIPVVYGLTCGELAELVKGEKMVTGLEALNLHVIRMTGYNRNMIFFATGLQWIPPSPNIPDPLTAIVYPGTCLFEATNISEGRGTPAPFLTIGAPFLNSAALTENLRKQKIPGLQFVETSFTPVSISGKSTHPKRENQLCNGIAIKVIDPAVVRPFTAGLSILYACMQSGGDSVVVKKQSFERLTGVSDIYTALMQHKTPDEIIATWQPRLKIFKNMSKKYYLYK